MTKAELTEKIIDTMIDPWTDDPEEYLYCTPINIYEATDLLNQIRDDENKMDLEPEDRLPNEVTPALIMDTYNCLIRAKKFEARTKRLAEYITDNEMVCEYSNYYLPEHENAIDMVPVDFLDNTDGFPFFESVSPLELMQIGVNSRIVFNPNHEFCWFDAEKKIMHSTDRPFRDGVLDAEEFARFILFDVEAFDYIFNDIMTEEEAEHILGCTKEEYINE